jgi:hypothetical protein
LHGRDVPRKGLIKRVGHISSIRVFDDPLILTMLTIGHWQGKRIPKPLWLKNEFTKITWHGKKRAKVIL